MLDFAVKAVSLGFTSYEVIRNRHNIEDIVVYILEFEVE